MEQVKITIYLKVLKSGAGTSIEAKKKKNFAAVESPILSVIALIFQRSKNGSIKIIYTINHSIIRYRNPLSYFLLKSSSLTYGKI